LFKTMGAKSTRWLLATTPFTKQILAMSEDALAEGLKQATNMRQGLKRARELMRLAAESIGTRQGSEACHPAYIQSIPRVGEITGALFLAEIGDPANYNNWREIQKLAGLNIRENDSGKHRGKEQSLKEAGPH